EIKLRERGTAHREDDDQSDRCSGACTSAAIQSRIWPEPLSGPGQWAHRAENAVARTGPCVMTADLRAYRWLAVVVTRGTALPNTSIVPGGTYPPAPCPLPGIRSAKPTSSTLVRS